MLNQSGMKKRTQKTSWGEFYKFDLFQLAEQLDINAEKLRPSGTPIWRLKE